MKKQTRNRYQKGLAKVLAVAFCTLCWTPAVYADVVPVGKDELETRYRTDLSKVNTAASDDGEKFKLDVTYRLTGDQRISGSIEIHSGMKVTIELADHKIFRQGTYLHRNRLPGEQPTDVRRDEVFSVEEGGQLIVRGPGMLDDELLPLEAGFSVESAWFWVSDVVRVEAGGRAEIDGTAGPVVFGNNIIRRNNGGVVCNYGRCVISFAEFADDVDTTKGGAIFNAGKLTVIRRRQSPGTKRVRHWNHVPAPGKGRVVNSHEGAETKQPTDNRQTATGDSHHEDSVEVFLGPNELWSRCRADWKAAVAKANGDEAKATLDVTYWCTADQRVPGRLRVHGGQKLTIYLQGHHLCRIVDPHRSALETDVNGTSQRRQLFSIESFGDLTIIGLGHIHDEESDDAPLAMYNGGSLPGWVNNLYCPSDPELSIFNLTTEGPLFENGVDAHLLIDGRPGRVVCGPHITSVNSGGLVRNFGDCVLAFPECADSSEDMRRGGIMNGGKLTLLHPTEGKDKDPNGVEEYHDEASSTAMHLVNTHARNKEKQAIVSQKTA
ncbi:MAG: hypothetical protein LBB04_02105 [Oscillospiraceae bacterium]|jgi:hypothetical protein|nr:hypothetical protein [Oscillospiraceae bacterium]